ncbi:MAG TPA: hypothetical protein PKZ08_10145 [Vicinamibacterales bacterium]|nr:hypothetical protein [Vicinamibacterales bacterium]
MTDPKTAAAMSTTIMDVGPDLAARWLEGNVRNRRIDQKHVDCLAQEMKAGRWKASHQGIAFDTSGTLVDGQHRLWAILQSGCTIRLAVSFNLPPESIDTIDGGKARTVVDRLVLGGTLGAEGVTKAHVATLRETARGLKHLPKMAYHQEAELMARHLNAVRFAAAHVATRAQGVGVAYVRAVVARAWYSVDHEQLERFCRVLSSGLPEAACDAGIIRLRDQLMATGSTRNRGVQRELYGKVERALLTWLKGEVRSALRPVLEEHFPLPEELKN